jgi:hypothetical protein
VTRPRHNLGALLPFPPQARDVVCQARNGVAVTLASPARVEEVIAKTPDWIKRQIRPKEARFLFEEVRRSGASRAIEIGVASGFSSAVIFAALRTNSWWPRLDALDLSERCYFDQHHGTGDAFHEIIGNKRGYALKLGAISADLALFGRRPGFAFIDGAHRSPWPAFDVIAVARFLKPGATIALHDIGDRFTRRSKKFGARHVFDAWTGDRRIDPQTPNIGVLHLDSIGTALESSASALSRDWEAKPGPNVLTKYLRIVRKLSGHNSQAACQLENILLARMQRAV